MNRHKNQTVLQNINFGHKTSTFHILINENSGLVIYYNITPVKLSLSHQEMFFSQYIFRT
jgi:hypothetical protein